jgi:geranylgeranyl pyrophosphate synthase
MPAALAIELIHGYAIIHDDLPALDDDFLRRGRPSSHAAFGEATAILAGDLLQSMAFQILSEPPEEGRFDPAARLRAINCLSRGCGLYGLAGGQYLDHDLDRGSSASIGEVIGMHLLKTGNIFAAAMAMGGILAGADPQGEMALSLVGSTAGVAFQLRSDLLSQSKKGPLEDGAPSHKKTKASSIAASEAVEVRDFIQGQLQFAIERAKEFKCEKLELLLLHIFGS